MKYLRILALLFFTSIACGEYNEIATTSQELVTTDACGVVVTANTIDYNCVKHPHWRCDAYDFSTKKCTRTKPRDPLPGTVSCSSRLLQNGDTIMWHGWGATRSDSACMIVPQFTFITQAGQDPDMLMEYGWSYSGKSIKVVGFMATDSNISFAQINGTTLVSYSSTLFSGDQKVWSSPSPTIWLTVPTYNAFVNGKLISSFYTF